MNAEFSEVNTIKEKQNKVNRRNFLKTMGAAGLAPAFAGVTKGFEASAEANAEKKDKPKYPQVPKRKLGKTGVEVPSLSLGTIFFAYYTGFIHRPGQTSVAVKKGGPNFDWPGIGKFTKSLFLVECNRPDG
ncbi:unnamed protein product [marine sediment metagenome]|uniref:Uncharacterized protein n=2 Tax=marine sediment metagenome TaxID=412755 RepID=X1PAP0_9ZZZZ